MKLMAVIGGSLSETNRLIFADAIVEIEDVLNMVGAPPYVGLMALATVIARRLRDKPLEDVRIVADNVRRIIVNLHEAEGLK